VTETAFSQALLEAALALIERTPGYAEAGAELRSLAARGRIVLLAGMEDRAHTGLTGRIYLGPEPFAEGSALGLAETLIHERFHLHQVPLLKTASFWAGVFTGTPVMRRYEAPAYRAALDFLEAVEAAFPELAAEARREQAAVRAVFAANYGGEP
jgi:hypothetical protein